MLPNFGQGAAKLAEYIATVASGPVSTSSGFLSPPAPRGFERPGRLFRVRFNPQRSQGRLFSRPFFVFAKASANLAMALALVAQAAGVSQRIPSCAAPSITLWRTGDAALHNDDRRIDVAGLQVLERHR